MEIKREQILLSLQSALLGEIYNSIRAIVFKYEANNRYFLLRYYLDREPNDDDFENVEIVITEFISNFKFTDFNKTKAECKHTTLPLSHLDIMDGIVYCRKEN